MSNSVHPLDEAVEEITAERCHSTYPDKTERPGMAGVIACIVTRSAKTPTTSTTGDVLPPTSGTTSETMRLTHAMATPPTHRLLEDPCPPETYEAMGEMATNPTVAMILLMPLSSRSPPAASANWYWKLEVIFRISGTPADGAMSSPPPAAFDTCFDRKPARTTSIEDIAKLSTGWSAVRGILENGVGWSSMLMACSRSLDTTVLSISPDGGLTIFSTVSEKTRTASLLVREVMLETLYTEDELVPD